MNPILWPKKTIFKIYINGSKKIYIGKKLVNINPNSEKFSNLY